MYHFPRLSTAACGMGSSNLVEPDPLLSKPLNVAIGEQVIFGSGSTEPV